MQRYGTHLGLCTRSYLSGRDHYGGLQTHAFVSQSTDRGLLQSTDSTRRIAFQPKLRNIDINIVTTFDRKFKTHMFNLGLLSRVCGSEFARLM